MEWLDRINQAVQYLEEHLDGEIQIERMAQIMCCSTYHLQRMFPFLTGLPLSEYIRRRRLTKAAFDLQHGEEKVIDIALKYGYQSPTAFTRAFTALHGVTPKDARGQGVTLKSYPRISFQISIKGEEEMNYKIEEKQAFRLVGVKERVNNTNGENFKRIPKFWQETMESGKCAKMCAISNGNPSGLMGVCANAEVCGEQFDYYIACSTNEPVPEGMEEVMVPACKWVVFTCTGPIPNAMQDVWKRIYTEWFPNSGYDHAMQPEIEWYSEGDMSKEDYISEIWVPVVEKK